MTHSRVLFGDCRESLRQLAADGVKVQMCVTSPPYFGLRDYGVAGQIGQEETPEQFIAALVEVFRCVRDVLADDGTLWVNIGDSYAGSGKGRNADGSHQKGGKQGTNAGTVIGSISKTIAPECKSKDLIGIPWMLAFALRADGWYLRQDIIWHKPNPMPESVTDRCTKSHEYIFLLSKSPRYFYDTDAVKEIAVGAAPSNVKPTKGGRANAAGDVRHRTSANLHLMGASETRNRRSVWTVATRPYKGAHFATFPPALIEPCILAGSRPGDIVIDPFFGSGTTGAVAVSHGRQYIGCELNTDYKVLQDERITNALINLNKQTEMDLI